MLAVPAPLQWLSLCTGNPLCRCFPEKLMIQHGRWRLLNSLWEFSDGFSCRLVSEHRFGSQGTTHGSTAGQEDAAFTPLEASLVVKPHMEGREWLGERIPLCSKWCEHFWISLGAPSTLLAVAFAMRPLSCTAEKHIFVHYLLLKSKSSIFLQF